MHIGIFGGTFDPVHLGHLLMAEAAREQLELDELWFLPAARSPLKDHGPIADSKHRVAMLRLAVAGDTGFRICEYETQREPPSFTVDTLERISRERPNDELGLLIGADAAAEFDQWREPGRILSFARIGVFRRPDAPPPDLAAIRALGGDDALPPVLIDAPLIDISSSDIRRRLAEGRSIRRRVPRAVEAYLREHQCYSQ